MTQFLTRRELREAEKSGRQIVADVPLQQLSIEVSDELAHGLGSSLDEVIQPSAVDPNQSPLQGMEVPILLSRREMRMAEARGQALPEQREASSAEAAEQEVSVSEPIPILVPEVILAAIEEVTAETAMPASLSTIDLSINDFTGSNLLAEPSTQSIVLDIAPEAISLPLDTMDGVSTGSISILPDPSTGTLTGALDGLITDNADRVDTVTGVITMVDPVSAMDIINQRVLVPVVSDDALSKNWWQAWAYGALGIGLAAATIVATIAIISAVGE